MYLKIYILTCLYANNYVLNSTELLILCRVFSFLVFSVHYLCYSHELFMHYVEECQVTDHVLYIELIATWRIR